MAKIPVIHQPLYIDILEFYSLLVGCYFTQWPTYTHRNNSLLFSIQWALSSRAAVRALLFYFWKFLLIAFLITSHRRLFHCHLWILYGGSEKRKVLLALIETYDMGNSNAEAGKSFRRRVVLQLISKLGGIGFLWLVYRIHCKNTVANKHKLYCTINLEYIEEIILKTYLLDNCHWQHRTQHQRGGSDGLPLLSSLDKVLYMRVGR